MIDIQSPTAKIGRGIKKDTKKSQGKNIMSASTTQGGHNYEYSGIRRLDVRINDEEFAQ